MDLINRDTLLQIFDLIESKFESNHKFIRCREIKYVINKMPSVVVDEEWNVDMEALTALLITNNRSEV